jgi:SAM-dependent methyltransferase
VKEFVGKFEVESREVYAQRREIVAACKLRPGMAVADIGAGTGLFTRLFATEVGPKGKVYAVDISPRFVAHVEKTGKAQGLRNVVGVVCKPDSVGLPANSIDLAFICDTYHHFEFPYRTMASVHKALRPGGQVVLIDFRRIEGKSSEWVLGHVRAGQEVFTKEIVSAGFKVVGEQEFLKENYFVRFKRVGPGGGQTRPSIKKLGTLDGDLVEMTPVVFRGRLNRSEYVRDHYHANRTGASYLRLIDVAIGEATPAFAKGYRLGCAFVSFFP